MTTRRTSSSSSSSTSEVEAISGRTREISETSRETGSRLRTRSPTNTIDGTSIAETNTVRSASPTASVATTANTGLTTASATSQQPQMAGGIPIIRPPGLQQESSTGIGVFGPQRPTGYPTQPPTTSGVNQQPIQIDVASAQQQYQQRAGQPEISPSSGSTVSTSSGSLSSPGTASIQQQPRFDAVKAVFNQADTNKDGGIDRNEFRQWAQGGIQQSVGAQFQQQQQQHQQQQPQFGNPIPAHQVYNELLGPDAFKDVILDIDYGAMGGFNVAFQSGTDFAGGQLPPGINIRPAYTTVDSLNYQQHMFNTSRTINAGGENSSSYDYTASSNIYGGGGGQQFDVAKAMFNQADVNHDGGIDRNEFRHWAQGGQQNLSGQSSYSTGTNYQTRPGDGGNKDSFYHASLFDGANPDIANILQQSGLGQVVPQ